MGGPYPTLAAWDTLCPSSFGAGHILRFHVDLNFGETPFKPQYLHFVGVGILPKTRAPKQAACLQLPPVDEKKIELPCLYLKLFFWVRCITYLM